jgi:rhodanese-related sulfurtransferase
MKIIGTPELKNLFDRGVKFTLINTLSPAESEHTLIPGAENVPLADERFCDKVEQLAGSKDAAVVVYCASSECDSSSEAANQLEAADFTDVMVYQGGAKAWQATGGLLAS